MNDATPTDRRPELRILTVCALILTTLAIAAAAYYISGVLIPFVLAVFFTYCLTPVIDFQIRWLKFPRTLAILTTVLLGCLIILLIGLLIPATIGQMAGRGEEYRRQLESLLDYAFEKLPMKRFGVEQRDVIRSVRETFGGIASTIVGETVRSIMSLMSNGALVIIYMIFLLSGRRPVSQTTGLRYEVEVQVKRYLLGMLTASSLTGVLVGLTLNILGVQFAWVFGFFAFLLNFIPNIGSIIATLLPMPVALLSPELSVAGKILALAIPAAIQITIGNFLLPRIMGRTLDLHPVTVLLTLIFFGAIWGIVGMFLATPITAVLKIFLERFEYTRPAAQLMAGRLGED